ncbi:MAG: 2-oxoacid:acceptor oxidoreductase family protein [Candidatus Omnitrophota bacterium]
MTEKIIFAGAGGQGIMLMAKILAQAAVDAGKTITWLPSYGAEVRGGAAHCMLIVSDNEIPSPFIDTCDTLIAMNEPSLRKYLCRLKKDGLLVLNSSLIKGKNTGRGFKGVKISCNDIAAQLGNIKVANMVAIGAYLARKRVVSLDSVFKVIRDLAKTTKKEELVKINKKALEKGFKYGRS